MSKKIALNLKEFKHVKSDGKTTTLQHKDGHQMTIVHAALPKDHQEQLQALAKSAPPQQSAEPKMMAEGGDVGNALQAMGVDESKDVRTPNVPDYSSEADAAKPSELESNIGKAMTLNGQVGIQPTPGTGISVDPQVVKESGLLQPGGQMAESPVIPSSEAPPEMSAQQPDAQQSADPYAQAGNMLERGVSEGRKGAELGAQAQEQLGKAQTDILGAHAPVQEKIRESLESTQKDFQQDHDNFVHDVREGYVSPDKYWSGIKNPNTGQMEGGHSKIMTGIGMILAGFNPTNHPNAAIDFLKHQMNMNLEAQKANLNSKENLLAANIRKYGSIREGLQAQSIQDNTMMSMELKKAEANAATPMAKAGLQRAYSQLDLENAQKIQQFNMQRAMMKAIQSNQGDANGQEAMIRQMEVMNPPMAKTYREAYVPGVGLSRTLQPVPTEARDQITAMKVLNDKGNDILNYVKQNTGTWDPKKKAIASQKIEEMKNFYNNSIKGGALTEGRLGWYDEQFSKNPTDRLAQFMGSSAKLKEVIGSNAGRLNQLTNQYGLPSVHMQTAQSSGNHQAALQWAQAHPGDPRSASIIKLSQGR